MSVEFDVEFNEELSFDVSMDIGDEEFNVGEDEHYAISGALDDLTDVAIDDPQNGQVLKYNSETDTWYNGSGGGGGGGGTDDYSDLSNKPKINGVTLSGNKSAADLSLGTYTKPASGIPDADIASASTWNAKGTYSKPSGGIPASDLASAVQISLGKADTALQSYTETDPVASAMIADEYSSSATYAVGDYCLHNGQLYECNTAISTAETWTAAHWTAVTVGDEISDLKEDITNKYTMPSGGIPSTDMASAVQTSLGKADTALQANQGSGNAGKWLTIANDGTVTAASLPVYSGGVS